MMFECADFERGEGGCGHGSRTRERAMIFDESSVIESGGGERERLQGMYLGRDRSICILRATVCCFEDCVSGSGDYWAKWTGENVFGSVSVEVVLYTGGGD